MESQVELHRERVRLREKFSGDPSGSAVAMSGTPGIPESLRVIRFLEELGI